MTHAERVDLAHEPDFVLGRLTVRPSHRELVRDDGAREVLEHRVMQVLIALAKARGSVVTRDELTQCCWDGRVVGEDAINRVISRLRKAADGIGAGSFRIETVTKIGYRLIGNGDADMPPPVASPSLIVAPRLSRRALLAGGALGVAAAIGGTYLLRSPATADIPPEVAPLVEQAWHISGQGTPESQSQLLGLYRRVVVLAPDWAEGWGALGLIYGNAARYRPLAESDAFRARALEAAARALELDPRSRMGQAARILAEPMRGNWLAAERSIRSALIHQPKNEPLRGVLSFLLMEVGRWREALKEFGPKPAAPQPGWYYDRIRALWSAGNLEETDKLISEAAALFPTHFALWFQRFYILMYGGQPGAAIAMAMDSGSRPTGIPQAEFDHVVSVARIIESRDPAEVDRLMTAEMALARQGNGYAENTIQYACALGRLDEAFAVANAYYFSRGFVVPDLRFTPEQGSYKPVRERDTFFLFAPSARQMRADPRFRMLTEELGLERYWREIGVQPDYRRV